MKLTQNLYLWLMKYSRLKFINNQEEYGEEEEEDQLEAQIPQSKYLTQFIQKKLPERTEILFIQGPDSLINLPTAFFILFLSIFFSLALYVFSLIDHQNFKSYMKATKDVMFALPISIILLMFNYILSDEQKSKINYIGVLDYIDIDKLLIQLAAFVILWMMIGLLFAFINQIQYSEWRRLESFRIQKRAIYKQYEQLHMNNQNAPEYQEIKKRVQYLLLRQIFICPSFQPPFVPQYLREDFDFPLFLLKASETIYFSLMRITLIIFILFIIVSLGQAYLKYYISVYLGIIVNPLYILIGVPYPITLFLQSFKKHHQNIFENLVHQVDSPYDFRLVDQQIKKDPINIRDAVPVPKYIQMSFRPNKKAGRILSLFIFKTKQAQIVILHGIVFLQAFWFILFFFTVLKPGSLIYYTLVALSTALGVINLFLFVPRIVSLLVINNNMNGMKSRRLVNRVALSQQLTQFQFMEKITCQLKGQLYKLIKQNDQLRESVVGESQLFSMTSIQKDILRQAFLRVVQRRKNQGLEFEIDEEQNPENGISEDTTIDVNDLNYVAQICGGRMEIWYVIMLAKTYFHDEDKIKFSSLVEFAGYNQRMIELGVRPFISQILQIKFEQKRKLTIQEFVEMISSDPIFTESELEYLVYNMQCMNPNDDHVQLEYFINYIMDSTSQFPQ